MSEERLVLDGRYRLIKPLGVGGMADVYLAEQVSLGRKVALKVLKRTLTGPEMQARFKREAILLSTVDHPAVLKVLDHDMGPDGTVLVLEYVDSRIASRLKRACISGVSVRLSTLSATLRPSDTCSAKYTSAMPPHAQGLDQPVPAVQHQPLFAHGRFSAACRPWPARPARGWVWPPARARAGFRCGDSAPAPGA